MSGRNHSCPECHEDDLIHGENYKGLHAECVRLRAELAKASRAMNEKVKAADDAEKIATAATNALKKIRDATLEEATQAMRDWPNSKVAMDTIRALKVSSTPTPAPPVPLDQEVTCDACGRGTLDMSSEARLLGRYRPGDRCTKVGCPGLFRVDKAAPAEVNQCDGCRRGLAVVSGMHIDDYDHLPSMACTAHLYKAAPVEAKTCHNCANAPLGIGSAVCKECCDSSERIRWVPEKKSQLPKLTVEEVKELRSRMLVSPETEVVLRETFTAPVAGQCIDCGNSMQVEQRVKCDVCGDVSTCLGDNKKSCECSDAGCVGHYRLVGGKDK